MLVEIFQAWKQASELMELDRCKAIRLLLCCHLDKIRPHLQPHTATNSSVQRPLYGLTSFLALIRSSMHSFCHASAT